MKRSFSFRTCFLFLSSALVCQIALAGSQKTYKHASEYQVAVLDQTVRIQTGTDATLGHTSTDAKLDTALEQVSATGDVLLKISALGSLGVLDYMQGDLRTSVTLLQQAVQMDDSAGGREVAAHYMGRLSQVLSYQGRNGDANQVLNAWFAYETKTQEVLDLAGCELFRSQALETTGQTEQAQQEIEKVLETSRDPLVTAEAHRQLALVLLHQGDVTGARNAIGKAQNESRGMLNEEDYLLPIGIAAARARQQVAPPNLR